MKPALKRPRVTARQRMVESPIVSSIEFSVADLEVTGIRFVDITKPPSGKFYAAVEGAEPTEVRAGRLMTTVAPKRVETPDHPFSKVESPVKRVWAICSANRQLSRAQHLELCVAAGINIHTARTQQSKWAIANGVGRR